MLAIIVRLPLFSYSEFVSSVPSIVKTVALFWPKVAQWPALIFTSKG